ncbi:hypothetical protein QTP86_022161 [Hemibagrus guttatus]|nr:hypothetical protein QTP86_022161 [Hemibagrus guttatus]
MSLISKKGRESTGGNHSPLFIDRSPLEIIKSTKFLGIHLAENLNLVTQHQLHHQETPSSARPEQLHHCLVQELHRLGSQDPAADRGGQLRRSLESLSPLSWTCTPHAASVKQTVLQTITNTYVISYLVLTLSLGFAKSHYILFHCIFVAFALSCLCTVCTPVFTRFTLCS